MKNKIAFIALKMHLSGKIIPRYIPLLNEDNLLLEDKLKKSIFSFEKLTISLPLDKQNDIYRDIIMLTYTCSKIEIESLYDLAKSNLLDELKDQLLTHRENWENWEALELKTKEKELDELINKIDKQRYEPTTSSAWCPACHESPCMCSDPF